LFGLQRRALVSYILSFAFGNKRRTSMTPRFLAFSLLAMLAFAARHADGQDGKKFAELDGTWTISKMEIEGRSLLEKGEKWQLVIKGGKVTSDAKNAPKQAVDLAKFLAPSKKPKTITYPYEGTITFYGIYEVKKDELRVCGDAVDTATEKKPEARRPKKFDSKQGLLLIFKRQKK
jgi:uncharacterized protein (TIGR03067 family)